MEITSARNQLREKIRDFPHADFATLALDLFRFQARHNDFYARFLQLLHVNPDNVQTPDHIPFLPIRFFKTQQLHTGRWSEEAVFTSSSTTNSAPSRHLVRDLGWYLENTRRGFSHLYGDPENYCTLALLPAYLERSGSSLIHMADYFIRLSRFGQSGFFLYNTRDLLRIIADCQKKYIPVLLLGVSFALLDLAEETGGVDLSGVVVMETGGMKGRRQEITREELHRTLCRAFGLACIHSEYGMTELFSQAYSKGEGLFHPAPTMRVLTREITDPLTLESAGRTGAVNVIDLANLDTVAFIATDDLGKVYADGSFDILGRMDASDIRGCNLLVS